MGKAAKKAAKEAAKKAARWLDSDDEGGKETVAAIPSIPIECFRHEVGRGLIPPESDADPPIEEMSMTKEKAAHGKMTADIKQVSAQKGVAESFTGCGSPPSTRCDESENGGSDPERIEPPLCPYLTPTVTLALGCFDGPVTEYSVHLGILSQSGVLGSMYTSTPPSASVQMGDIDPSIFELLLYFLYGRDYRTYTSLCNPVPLSDEPIKAVAFQKHALLYFLARRYELERLVKWSIQNIENMGRIDYQRLLYIADEIYHDKMDRKECWFREYFKEETRKEMVKNVNLIGEPFVRDVFFDSQQDCFGRTLLSGDLFTTLTEGYSERDHLRHRIFTPASTTFTGTEDDHANGDDTISFENGTSVAKVSPRQEVVPDREGIGRYSGEKLEVLATGIAPVRDVLCAVEPVPVKKQQLLKRKGLLGEQMHGEDVVLEHKPANMDDQELFTDITSAVRSPSAEEQLAPLSAQIPESTSILAGTPPMLVSLNIRFCEKGCRFALPWEDLTRTSLIKLAEECAKPMLPDNYQDWGFGVSIKVILNDEWHQIGPFLEMISAGQRIDFSTHPGEDLSLIVDAMKRKNSMPQLELEFRKCY